MSITDQVVEQQPVDGSRACLPDEDRFIERDGVRVFWESFGTGDQTMPEGGEHEAGLTADYNAQMVEHIDAHPSRATAPSSSATPTTSSTSGSARSCR